MKILAVYRGLPWPYSEGYHLRVLHLFRRLRARGHEIHLLGLIHEEGQAEKLAPLTAERIFHSITLERFPRRSWFGRLRTNLGVDPPASLKAEYPGFGRRLRARVQELRARLGVEVAYVFDPWADVLFSDALLLPTLLDVCDCRSLYYQRQLERSDLPPWRRARVHQLLRRFQALEGYTLERYPLATAISPLDQAALRALRPSARVEVVANGVDLEMFRPLPDVAEKADNLILFGNMDFLPNVDAAIHFAREILPRVRERRLQANFTIVGTRPVPEVRRLAEELDGVEVTGGVPDLKPWIQRATMLVAPMRFGAGMKNKILETLAMEKPVVTNATGIESFDDEVRGLLRVAHDDQEFADLVCDLLDAPEERARIGTEGRALMQRRHSWEVAAARYEALFLELAATAP